MMKLKTTTHQAIELAQPTDSSTEFVLRGTESARDLFPVLSREPQNYTSEKYSFQNVFGFDCEFYYRLEKYNHRLELLDTEIGLGHIVKNTDHISFIRTKAIIYRHAQEDFVAVRLPVNTFNELPDTFVILCSHTPSSLAELLIYPNNLVVSNETNPLNIVTIEKNSVLGRLDGDPRSVSITDLSEKTFELLLSYTKQMVLGCSQLDVKKIKTSCLQLKPSNKSAAKEGSIIYNDKTKLLEYYTGSEWRTLTWELSSDS